MTEITVVNTPDNILLKDKILKSAIKQQQKLVEEYRLRINDITSGKSNEKDEHENHHRSFRQEALSEVSLLSDQLQVVSHELDELRHIQNYETEVHPCVEYGTIVKTNKGIFFISGSIDKFSVDDLVIIGLPVQSAIYKMMKGKKTGDIFTHNETMYQIEEIF